MHGLQDKRLRRLTAAMPQTRQRSVPSTAARRAKRTRRSEPITWPSEGSVARRRPAQPTLAPRVGSPSNCSTMLLAPAQVSVLHSPVRSIWRHTHTRKRTAQLRSGQCIWRLLNSRHMGHCSRCQAANQLSTPVAHQRSRRRLSVRRLPGMPFAWTRPFVAPSLHCLLPRCSCGCSLYGGHDFSSV